MTVNFSIYTSHLKSILQLLGICLAIMMVLSNCSTKSKDEPYKRALQQYKENKNKGNLTERIGVGSIPTVPPKTPQEEEKTFHLPPGFKIQLVASEPDIGRPINMAFDARGRLWVSQSANFPFPSNKGHKRRKDRISILADTNGDGKADVFKEFADSLHIPIGLLPTLDGGAIAYSIPSIYKFDDTNGDGRADRKKILYTGFGHKDTHGMINNLKWGFDGWIYGCHGFANKSVVQNSDGDTLATMRGAAVYRFRPDGSDFEVVTRGQVNLFGLTFDKWGNIYTSDSHTDPIYQNIPGGDYPIFSKQPTGLGFGPHAMHHIFSENQPTARTGLPWYDGLQFPEKYRHSFYQGNVLTHKIFRDTLAWHGATPEIAHAETFLTSDDPYFRPVNEIVGPNGALYIADFYNQVIGDYEVPHDDPRRMHHLGRIWKITYSKDTPSNTTDWSAAILNTLMKELGNPQLQTRLQVANQLVNRMGRRAVPAVRAMVGKNNSSSVQKIHGLWVLFRLNALPDTLLSAATQDTSPLVRTHAMRILGEMSKLNRQDDSWLIVGLKDENAHVQRAAVEALAKNPSIQSLEPVMMLVQHTPKYDTHMRYAGRLCLRNHLRKKRIMQNVLAKTWNENDMRTMADVMPGVPSVEASRFLISFLKQYNVPKEKLSDYISHITRYVPEKKQDEVASLIQGEYAGQLDFQQSQFNTVKKVIAQRGETPGEAVKSWGINLAAKYLDNIPSSSSLVWHNILLTDSLYQQNPWDIEQLAADSSMHVLTSRSYGKNSTGMLISPIFTLPGIFSFYLYGQDDASKKKRGNRVQLRLQKTAGILKKTTVAKTSKNNNEQHVVWKMANHTGEKAHLEVVGRANKGGNWIGVGGFKPTNITVPSVSPAKAGARLTFAANIARSYTVPRFAGPLRNVLVSHWADISARVAAAAALVKIDASKYMPLSKKLVEDNSIAFVFRDKLVQSLSQTGIPEVLSSLTGMIPMVPKRIKTSIARSLAQSVRGADKLVNAGKEGAVSQKVLADAYVYEYMQRGKPEELQDLYKQLVGEQENRSKVIKQRLASFNRKKASPQKGRQVFVIHCEHCHSVNGQGGDVGPNLDGIGIRGAAGLTPFILNPSVMPGFELSIITLKNGEVRTGRFIAKEGAMLVFANMEGKEFSIPQKDIAKRTKQNSKSMMPSFFSKVLSPTEFHNLLAYLLTLGNESE